MKKKIITIGVLVFFCVSVFFGTFFKGGYVVKADDLILGQCIGYVEVASGESDIEYELEYIEGDEQYKFTIIFSNSVFEYDYEDITPILNVDALNNDFTDFRYLGDVNSVSTLSSVHLNDVYQEIDEDLISLYIEFLFDATEWEYNYLQIEFRLSGLYLDVATQNNEITMHEGFICLSSYIYTHIFNSGYNVGYIEGESYGYDDGYTEGHEDGYAEGYTLGETTGYNDGLDVGYYNGYEVGHYEGYTEGEAYGYSTGLDEGYWYGLDEGLNVSGYKEAYEKGIAKAENTASTWFKGLFDGFQRFLNIQIMGVSIGTIILIPFAISFVWFIIRQFRGGGGD